MAFKLIVVKGVKMFILKNSKSYIAKTNFSKKEPQIFDLLQLSRKEREYRSLCIRTMRKFNDWKKSKGTAADPLLNFYSQVEGTLLRRQAQDAILFYRLIKKDRMRAFNDYINKLPAVATAAGVMR